MELMNPESIGTNNLTVAKASVLAKHNCRTCRGRGHWTRHIGIPHNHDETGKPYTGTIRWSIMRDDSAPEGFRAVQNIRIENVICHCAAKRHGIGLDKGMRSYEPFATSEASSIADD